MTVQASRAPAQPTEAPAIRADVAIIGAGPAGLATAIHLGQLGVERVVVVDGREVHAKHTVVADGAHSQFCIDRGRRRLIQAIMGWWEGVIFEPHHIEMIFDRMVAPLYGW